MRRLASRQDMTGPNHSIRVTEVVYEPWTAPLLRPWSEAGRALGTEIVHVLLPAARPIVGLIDEDRWY